MSHKKCIGLCVFRAVLFGLVWMWAAVAMADGATHVAFYKTAATPMWLQHTMTSQGDDVAITRQTHLGSPLSDVVIFGQTATGKWFEKQTIQVNGPVQALHYVGQTLMARSCEGGQCLVLVYQPVGARLQHIQSIPVGSKAYPNQWIINGSGDEVFLEVDGQFVLYRQEMMWTRKARTLDVQRGQVFAASAEDLFVVDANLDTLSVYKRTTDGAWSQTADVMALPTNSLAYEVVIDGEQALIYCPDSLEATLLMFVKQAGQWHLQTSLKSPVGSDYGHVSLFLKDQRMVIQTNIAATLWYKDSQGRWTLHALNRASGLDVVASVMVDGVLLTLNHNISTASDQLIALDATPSGWMAVQGPLLTQSNWVNQSFLVGQEYIFVHVKGVVSEHIEVLARCDTGCTNRRSSLIELSKNTPGSAWWALLLFDGQQLFVRGAQRGEDVLFVYEVVEGQWTLVQSIEANVLALRKQGQSLLLLTRDGLRRMTTRDGLWDMDTTGDGQVKCRFAQQSRLDDRMLDCADGEQVNRLYFDEQLQLQRSEVLVDRRAVMSQSDTYFDVRRHEIWALDEPQEQTCQNLKVDIYHENARWQKTQSLPLNLVCSQFYVHSIVHHGATTLIKARVDGQLLLGWFERDTDGQWLSKGWYESLYGDFSRLALGSGGLVWSMSSHVLYHVAIDDLSQSSGGSTQISEINRRFEVVEDQSLVLKDQQRRQSFYYQLIAQPKHGQLVDKDGQRIQPNALHHHNDLYAIYRPDADYHGADKVAFLIIKDQRVSHMETWHIMVQPSNDRPESKPQAYTAQAGQVLYGQFDASDTDGDVLRYEVVSQPPGGGVEVDEATGRFVYNVPQSAQGRIGFEYRAFDGKVFSKKTFVTVEVTAVQQDEHMMPERRQRAQQSGGGSAIGCSSPFGQPASLGSVLGLWVVFALGRRRARRRRFMYGGRA